MNNTEIIIYKNDDILIELIFEREAKEVWLTQKQLAELFDVDVSTINEHLQDIFKSNELQENSVIGNFPITAQDGKEYSVMHYNLAAITAVGYRVNSDQAIKFRQWVTNLE